MRLVPLLLATLAPGFCAAQDDTSDNAIHAITAIHADGTRTVTVTNPDTKSSEADTYDARGRLMEKVVYTLDDNNQPATGTVYDARNQPAFKAVYKRDDFSRMSEEDDYTMDDQLLRRFTYEYDGAGKLLRVRAFDSNGNEMRQTDAVPDVHRVPPRVHR